jgi:hypothetical protein
MKSFLIAADPQAAACLNPAVRNLNGQPLTHSSWIVEWNGTADSLCRHLRAQCDSRVAACSIDTDWSYR